jgi:hypothetical protein
MGKEKVFRADVDKANLLAAAAMTEARKWQGMLQQTAQQFMALITKLGGSVELTAEELDAIDIEKVFIRTHKAPGTMVWKFSVMTYEQKKREVTCTCNPEEPRPFDPDDPKEKDQKHVEHCKYWKGLKAREPLIEGQDPDYRACSIHNLMFDPRAQCPKCQEEFQQEFECECGHLKRKHLAAGRCKMKDCDCMEFKFKAVMADEAQSDRAPGDGKDEAASGAIRAGAEDGATEQNSVPNVHESSETGSVAPNEVDRGGAALHPDDPRDLLPGVGDPASVDRKTS